jgi:hypothetical protein
MIARLLAADFAALLGAFATVGEGDDVLDDFVVVDGLVTVEFEAAMGDEEVDADEEEDEEVVEDVGDDDELKEAEVVVPVLPPPIWESLVYDETFPLISLMRMDVYEPLISPYV